jgi:hypothetical protein
MRQLVFLVFICFAFSQVTAFADVAGEITFASGEVRIGKSNGKPVDVGTKINEGVALETGADGHLHIKFIDGGILILRPNTASVVENYSLNSANPSQSRMRIVVLHGTVRSVTGAGAKATPGQFRLKHSGRGAWGPRYRLHGLYRPANHSRPSNLWRNRHGATG